jgi:hypothetical protein
MHPQSIEQIARQRNAEVRRMADSGRLCHDYPGRRSPIRHRTGWTLVAIGLRIAHDSGEV